MIIPLIPLFLLSAFAVASQQPFDTGQSTNDVAPFIFNALSTLLTQWPNTYHPNGHTIITGTLEPYTLLYHARKDLQVPPPSPEWLAFDPEMSYGIMAGSTGTPTYLQTYRSMHPARVVYFDGMSSALSDHGWLDSQEVLVSKKGKEGNREETIKWWDDYGRARRLCKWAKPRGVEGFVRMNSGFEVLWCNFVSSPLRLVSNLNITPPGTPDATIPSPPDPKEPWRPRVPTSPMVRSSRLEWLLTVTHRATSPQPHIWLDYTTFVTFYHPRLQSLVPSRVGQPMGSHRIWTNISEADALSVASEVDEVLRRTSRENRIDWGKLAIDVVQYWADRIMHLNATLLNSTLTTNVTEALDSVRLSAYFPLTPYMNTGFMRYASGWEMFFGGSSPTAFDRCASSATEFLPPSLVPQEALLRESILDVLRRICTDFGVIFAETMDNDDLALERWSSRVNSLMEWLDWAAWMRCEELCTWNSICVMPMWPILWPPAARNQIGDWWKPQCVLWDV